MVNNDNGTVIQNSAKLPTFQVEYVIILQPILIRAHAKLFGNHVLLRAIRAKGDSVKSCF